MKGVLAVVDLAALRFAISGLVMLPWFLKRGFAGLAWWQVLAIAVTAGPGFAFFAFAGFTFAPASHGGVLLPGILPLWTATLAVLLLGERFGPWRRLALALIASGVACLGWTSLGEGGPGQWKGDLFFMCASFSWACYTIMARAWKVAPLDAAAVVMVPGALVYMPIYFLFFPSHLAEASWGELVFQGVYHGVIATIVSIIAFTRAVRALGATTTTMITAMVPATVAIAAIPLLGEYPTPLTWVGLAVVTAGMLATLRDMAAPVAPPMAEPVTAGGR